MVIKTSDDTDNKYLLNFKGTAEIPIAEASGITKIDPTISSFNAFEFDGSTLAEGATQYEVTYDGISHAASTSLVKELCRPNGSTEAE